MIARVLGPLASLRLTCAALALLALWVVADHTGPGVSRMWLAPPLSVLAVNLLAALVCNGRLRRSGGLLLFHVALLVVCVLASAGVLTEFEGRIELAEGQDFEGGNLHTLRSGPWSDAPPSALPITQGVIDVDFVQGLVRQQARSQFLLRGGQRRVVTDSEPLIIEGYRVAPSANKGFAVVLAWRGADGATSLGSLDMPSYPAMEWKQEQLWRTPAGESVQVRLMVPPRPSGDWTLRSLLSATAVTLRGDGRVVDLRPGETVRLRGGAVSLVAVRLWMGYRVTREPALAVLLAVAFVGAAALGWHVLRKHFAVSRPLTTGADPVTGPARALRG